MRGVWVVGGVVLALAGGCEAPGRALTVRVQSGLRAGFEARWAEAAIASGAVPCTSVRAGFEGRALEPSDQSALGRGEVTVASFEGLSPGLYTVRARFRRPRAGGGEPDSGDELVSRCVVVSLENDRVVRVPLTSDCLDVVCPAPAGSPAYTECLHGRCVDPRCDADDPTTAAFCCDREALGDACDTDPTLCRDGSGCTRMLACSGASRCEDGVCVAPDEDECPEGQYCDATDDACRVEPSLVPLDAGALDASAPDAGLDAPEMDAPRDDAYVPPGVDADLDASTPPDAWTPDAWAGADAWTPDAWAPDAWVEPESCDNALDEGGDGLIDCEDPSCAGRMECAVRAGCPVPTGSVEPGTVGLPDGASLWLRADLLVGVASSQACAWRDLVGGRVMRPTSDLRAPRVVSLLGGLPAIRFALGDAMTVREPAALAPDAPRTIVVVARHAAGTSGRLFVTTETRRDLGIGIAHRSVYGVELPGTFPYVPTLATELAAQVAVLPAGAAAPISAMSFRLDGVAMGLVDPMDALLPHTPDRHWVGGRDNDATLDIAEVVLYPRVLDAADLALVDAYVSSRYGLPPG